MTEPDKTEPDKTQPEKTGPQTAVRKTSVVDAVLQSPLAGLSPWILLSLPVAVVVGRMFAARPDAVAVPVRAPSASVDRVAHVSRVECRRSEASRWAHEARVLSTSRRRVAVASGSAARITG